MVEIRNQLSVDEIKIDEIIDKDTGVHYLLCAHYGHHGNTLAVTPMYNSNGTLKISYSAVNLNEAVKINNYKERN